MHRTQTIATDVLVCQSVCHAASLGFGVQKRLNGSRSCLGRELLGPKEHCEGGESMKKCD